MTKVPTFLSILIGGIFLSSCSVIVFEQPIPPERAALEEIPSKFQGIWCNNEGDTLEIQKHDLFEGDGRRVGDEMPLVVKAKRKTLYVNYQEEYYWHLGIIELHGNSLDIFWFNPEEDDLSPRIAEITHLKEVRDENDELKAFLINPSPKEWKTIERKRIFSEVGTFTKQ